MLLSLYGETDERVKNVCLTFKEEDLSVVLFKSQI